ncbi:MAG: hypothetical protein A3J74_06035 [Elusimicrobia bacterium RIFCSPHIGHO2_02_FULL_57_9]|nr:MAG: hypothetical protein A3J74_06035 [Elusimicrobia bacterium RIFCSPHIGHO2_02_FULL_57_9]
MPNIFCFFKIFAREASKNHGPKAHKNRFSFFLLLLISSVNLEAVSITKAKEADSLFLDMSKVNLGRISDEDKKNVIYAIQLEKARITRRTLKGVYENAFDLYRQGQYESARELTMRILTIDPAYEDASTLHRATIELKGSKKHRLSERKLIEDKFEEGMLLYSQGRRVEAAARWEEAAKLSPGNLKARYWLKKVRAEMAENHFLKGQQAYRQRGLREALDQWYAALVLNPRYPRLTAAIAKVESEAREQEIGEKMQSALNLYSQGQTIEALKMLDQVLQVGPGNSKAQKLMAEIRAEMANQHVGAGRQLYESRKYDEAIKEWKVAVGYGYDPKAADQLITRAKEQMRREDAARKKDVEIAKMRDEQARKEAEEKAKAEAEARARAEAQAQGPMTPSGISEEARRSAEQHYLSGVIFFQKGDYDKARDEWNLAKKLDAANADAQAGLERIEKLYGGSR